jgi:hypothetical protein
LVRQQQKVLLLKASVREERAKCDMARIELHKLRVEHDDSGAHDSNEEDEVLAAVVKKHGGKIRAKKAPSKKSTAKTKATAKKATAPKKKAVKKKAPQPAVRKARAVKKMTDYFPEEEEEEENGGETEEDDTENEEEETEENDETNEDDTGKEAAVVRQNDGEEEDVEDDDIKEDDDVKTLDGESSPSPPPSPMAQVTNLSIPANLLPAKSPNSLPENQIEELACSKNHDILTDLRLEDNAKYCERNQKFEDAACAKCATTKLIPPALYYCSNYESTCSFVLCQGCYVAQQPARRSRRN